MDKLVSVVIPVYNGENTIEKCVESVLKQTYDNIEIVIVNDGSADNTDKAVKELLKKYGSIKYICKENSGVSSARNFGIENSCGEYIVFLDSDDTIEAEFIEKLYEQCGDKILPVCGMNIVYSEGSFEKRVYSDDEPVSSADIKDIAFVYSRYLLSSAANKMYSRKVIVENNISFPTDIANGEDLIFNLSYAEHMKEFKIINEALYNYNVFSEGTLHTVHDSNRFYFISRMYREFEEVLKKLDCDDDSFAAVKKMIMSEYVFAIQLYMSYSEDNSEEKTDNLRKIFKSGEYNSVTPYLKEVCGRNRIYYPIKIKSPLLLNLYYCIKNRKNNRS